MSATMHKSAGNLLSMLVGDTDPLPTNPNNLQSFLAKATSIDLKEKSGRF